MQKIEYTRSSYGFCVVQQARVQQTSALMTFSSLSQKSYDSDSTFDSNLRRFRGLACPSVVILLYTSFPHVWRCQLLTSLSSTDPGLATSPPPTFLDKSALRPWPACAAMVTQVSFMRIYVLMPAFVLWRSRTFSIFSCFSKCVNLPPPPIQDVLGHVRTWGEGGSVDTGREGSEGQEPTRNILGQLLKKKIFEKGENRPLWHARSLH